jgi:hypothetical protein
MAVNGFYTYIATELIFGKNSPEIKDFLIYRSEYIKGMHNGLSVAESSAVFEDNIVPRIRTACFSKEASIRTSHINATNDIARIVTYINSKENVTISDVLFNEEDLKNNLYIWKRILFSKVESLAVLIRSFNEMCIDDIPLCISDFSNIVQVLFMKPWVLKKNEA